VGVKDYTGLTAGFMKLALEMLRMGMKPVFVFDGGRAPQKDATNEVQPNKRFHTDLCTGARTKKTPKMALRARKAGN
jgi:5'-3' exonuclease